ncbi:class B sortase [Candidatus Saccharibacteria bacterium]|nr:class B sortase [Candidatus Saccharibacteria bacterium]
MSGAKRKKRFLIVALFFTVVFWTAAGIWLVRSLTDNNRADEQIDETQDLVSADEVEMPTAESAEVENGNGISLLSVELGKLKEKNSDTVGWVQILGTNVNYPFVQGRENDYYRTHSFNKSYNLAGWVALDYRNSANLTDNHSILYLHGKLKGTEFEPARSVISNSYWLNNPEKFIIRTSTDYSNELWQVFSIYKTTADDYAKLSFRNDAEKKTFAEKLAAQSVYNFNVPFEEDDKILTFSVRYDDEHIVVIHAKLFKGDTTPSISAPSGITNEDTSNSQAADNQKQVENGEV